MASKREISFTARVPRKLWFQFTTLCHSHGVSVSTGVAVALRDMIQRAGVEVDEDDAPEAGAESPSDVNPQQAKLRC